MKSLLLFSFLFIAFTSGAQIKKGAVSLGVDFSFSGGKSSSNLPNSIEGKNFDGSAGITAGKAIEDNLFIGAGVNYGTSNNKNVLSGNTTSEQKSNLIGGSVWVRKYYPVLKSFYLFVNGGLSVTGSSTESEQASVLVSKYTGFTVSATVYPGISYQMRKNFFLDASVNSLANIFYSHGKSENFDSQGALVNTNKSDTYGVSTSIGNSANPLQIGMRWIIQK